VSERTPLQDFVLRFRRVPSIVVQLALVAVCNRLAFWLRFDNGAPSWALSAFWYGLPWLLVIRALAFIPFRLYEGLWRYTSIYDLQALIGGVSLSSIAFYGFARSPWGPAAYPRSIFITDAILLTMALGGIRLTRRFLTELRPLEGRRMLVFGAGDAGELIVRDMKTTGKYQPVGFVDDDTAKVGRRIHGVPVLGQHVANAHRVGHVADDGEQPRCELLVLQLHPNRVETVLVSLEHDERCGPEPRDLAAQL